MSKLMKSYLLASLIALVSAAFVHAASTKFTNVEVTSNLTVDGTLTSASCAPTNSSATFLNMTATKGVVASTGTFTNSTNAVTVSSSTTSSDKLYLGGAFASLPTTGFSRGALIVDTADQKLYISTETVVGTVSWKSVGSQ